MNIEEEGYALSLPGVTEDQPFGEDNVTFRVEGKIFLCLWVERDKMEGRATLCLQIASRSKLDVAPAVCGGDASLPF